MECDQSCESSSSKTNASSPKPSLLGLEETGYTAKVVDTGEATQRRLCNEPFDQMPLDGILSSASGLEALPEMRPNGFKIAPLRTLHRRAKPDSPSVLLLAELRMDTHGHTVTRGTAPLDLTVREFELLEYHRGAVVSREIKGHDVCETTVCYPTQDNVFDVHITIPDDPCSLNILHTFRGVGFIFREEEGV
jgi:DNA-binding response OmpR family regulator